MIKNNKIKKGFSLVELIVVITIIAILSVTAYMAMGGQTGDARNSVRMQDLSTIQSALEVYYVKYSEYPSDIYGNNTNWRKILPKVPTDPWGNNYVYATGNNGKKYQLAATLETEDGGFKAYVVGNGDELAKCDIKVDNTKCDSAVNCDEDGGNTTCFPYMKKN